MKGTVAHYPPRNVVKKEKRTDVMTNGIDNNYPERVDRIVKGSVTSKASYQVYSSFLAGDGFATEELNGIVVGERNYKPVLMSDLLNMVARSIALQNGVFIQCNINANHKITDVNGLNYKFCRFGHVDDISYAGKVAYYENWDKSKSSRIQKKDFNWFDVYNTRPEVIDVQVANAGGWGNYKGQVYHFMMEDDYLYSLAPIDAALNDADTEQLISVFKNGELSNNFFAKYIIRHAFFESPQDKARFVNELISFQGADNNGSFMLVEDDINEDDENKIDGKELKLEKIEQNINDKLFIDWEKSVANNIRKAYGAIPQVLIDSVEGRLMNTSGESLRAAIDFYNELTQKNRNTISRIFKELFSTFQIPIEDNFEIKPLSSSKNGTN